MRRRVLLLAAATAGCRGATPSATPFALAALAVAQQANPRSASDEPWCLAELGRLVELARAARAGNPGASAATVLRQLLFGELGFAREVEDPDLRFVLLPGVLRLRRGSCVK